MLTSPLLSSPCRGHDFRPDYTKLGFLKHQYPHVPLLALTATATPRVQEDVKVQLRIPNCLVFKSSFNRSNLRYEMRKKGPGSIEDIRDLITQRFTDPIPGGGRGGPNGFKRRKSQCGIIYCYSKQNCEDVAEKLRELFKSGDVILDVEHYHAGVESEKRERTQRDWSMGRVQVIVATIAFGMGINKPDVRFVIHHSLSKSLEGYHQETGRAGRDGRESWAFLYYSYRDAINQREMMRRSAKESGLNPNQLAANEASLDSMVCYASDKIECRRVLLLRHFAEDFNASQCGKTCDNCISRGNKRIADKDVTDDAAKILHVASWLSNKHHKLNEANFVCLLRGSKKKDLVQMGLIQEEFKVCGHLSTPQTSDLVKRLVIIGALKEEISRVQHLGHSNVSSYLRYHHPAADPIMRGTSRVVIQVLDAEKAAAAPDHAVDHAPARVCHLTTHRGQITAHEGPEEKKSNPRKKSDGDTKQPKAKVPLKTNPIPMITIGQPSHSGRRAAGESQDEPIELSDDGMDAPPYPPYPPNPKPNLPTISLPPPTFLIYHKALEDLNNHLAECRGVGNHAIFGPNVLMKLAEERPIKPCDLKKIEGLAMEKITNYGGFVIEVIKDINTLLSQGGDKTYTFDPENYVWGMHDGGLYNVNNPPRAAFSPHRSPLQPISQAIPATQVINDQQQQQQQGMKRQREDGVFSHFEMR